MFKWVIIGLVLAMIPIWRDPLWSGGISAYEALYNFATKPQKEHIPVTEAIRLARESYEKYR